VTIGCQSLQFIEHEEPQGTALPQQPSGSVSMLRELIAIAVSLLRSRDDSLFQSLVISVSRLLSCDAARFVVEDEEGQLTTVARFPQQAGNERFSNRAIDWAREAACTVLVHENAWKDLKTSGQSLEKNLVASIMCAPLKHEAFISGYLYLDRIDKTAPFTEDDRSFCDALLPLFSEILAGYQERRLQRETIARLQQQQTTPWGGILYESDAMAKVIDLARRFARTESPVLITGETGTGKELFARLILEHSLRANGPFRAINCGAIPENLIESELFGHEKGAFTGATGRKIGLFESAQCGTVFLDEIGELPLHLQVKLLRTLQESQVVRIGGSETIMVDVRIIAATNRNLEEAVIAGSFRRDLFFRLNVLTLHLPPLRDRGNDVILLAAYFVNQYCRQFGLPEKGLSASARKVLTEHSWPGNVRELENVIQKAILLSEGSRLTQESFSLTHDNAAPFDQGQPCATLRDARAEAEKRAIIKALESTHGNVVRASQVLDIDRKWVIKKMEDMGIKPADYRR
jgi:transcriptional regulator with GAF, ATPase, and Fis domain